jgi:hypothetical protein
MNNLSYTLTDKIQEDIKAIEVLRSKVLLTPIKPKTELKLRWEANINKTYWGLNLADNPMTKAQMSKLMSNTLSKKLKNTEKEVISYMNTLNLIREFWTANITALNSRGILEIYDLSCKPIFGSTASYFKSKELEIKKILAFIESGKDHPVIKAGLLQIEIIKLSPFENGTGRVARLLSHLMLARYGYDLRGLLVLEDYYRSDLVSLKEATNSIEKDKNATKWLTYFITGIKLGLEKVLKNLDIVRSSNTVSFWKLSERQKRILEGINNPEVKITNKLIQKMFKISQITASRDLSKMANLGILLSHGKGRSTYYTR